MLAASGASFGSQAQVALPSSSSLWYPPEGTSNPAEALEETEISQTIDAVYGTVAPAPAPVGLSAPSTATVPITVGPPGVAPETSGEQSKSIPCLFLTF